MQAARRRRAVLSFLACRIYVENGSFGCTLDVSTLSSSFRAFFATFFAFFIVFRTAFVFLDIRGGPPMAFWLKTAIGAV